MNQPRTRKSDPSVFVMPARGPRGEPVDLRRTFLSHGVATLPPMQIADGARSLRATLRLPAARPRTVEVTAVRGKASIHVLGGRVTPSLKQKVRAAVSHILRLDEDLSAFYDRLRTDPELSWAAHGAGRLIRSQTVFEEVVKTICTTNCAWSATVRMVGAMVEHLGEPAVGAPARGVEGRAFPRPAAIAEAGPRFFSAIARAGYRGPYLVDIATAEAAGQLGLEDLTDADRSDDEVEERLLALPGVGPYAAAHTMMMLGRYSSLILDAWSRPTYARLSGRRASDDSIVRRFRPYGRFAGLAFWLFLTKDWVDETVEG